MKKFLLLLLLSLLFVACSDENDKEYVKLIGTVNLRMTRLYEDGRKTGSFVVIKYLSKTKIELLENDRIVETTRPKLDSAMEIFYLLTHVEKNREYRLRISLNDSMIKVSRPFIVHDTDLKFYSADLFREEIGYSPEWLSSGYYYRLFLMDKANELMFVIEDTTNKEKLYPNPVMSLFQFQFYLTKESNVSIDVLDILLKPVKNLMENETLKAGTYALTDQNTLPDGLYLMRLKVNDAYSYYAFVQGKDGIIYMGM